MNNKTRRFAGRLLAFVLLATMLLTALTGCATSSKNQPAAPTSSTISNSAATEGNAHLDADVLNAISEMLTAAYSASFDTRELLIAAYRGYDMLAEGFDDTKVDPTVVKEPDMDAVRKVLDQAREAVEAEDRVTVSEYAEITAEDTLLIIQSMQTTADLDSDGGFLDKLLGWIGSFLGWLDRVTGSYLIALMIFAVLVELLMLPLGIRQHKNSIRQAKLRPKEMAIRKKYAGRDDQATRQKVTNEIQDLYQRENFSPYSGCLPLFLQIPIILALYQIVINPLQYVLGQSPAMSTALTQYYTAARAAGGLGMAIPRSGTIEILSRIGDKLDGLKDFLFYQNGTEIYDRMSFLKLPDFNLGSINLGNSPSFNDFSILWLVPALTFIVYFTSMKLTKKFTYQPTMNTDPQDKQTACSNQIMDFMMPIMSTWVCFMVPALVGIYWMFKSVISTLRQFIVAKAMPYPKFTEEDYRAAEREYAGKAPKKGTPAPTYSYPRGTKTVGGKPKSLFHMDDDDYVAKIEEETRREQEEAEAREQKAQKKAGVKGISSAELKDDEGDKENK